jgi:hypothetical protein
MEKLEIIAYEYVIRDLEDDPPKGKFRSLNHTGFILIAITDIKPKPNLMDIRLGTSFFSVPSSFYRSCLKPSEYMKRLLSTCHTSRITAMREVNGSNENCR